MGHAAVTPNPTFRAGPGSLKTWTPKGGQPARGRPVQACVHVRPQRPRLAGVWRDLVRGRGPPEGTGLRPPVLMAILPFFALYQNELNYDLKFTTWETGFTYKVEKSLIMECDLLTEERLKHVDHPKLYKG